MSGDVLRRPVLRALVAGVLAVPTFVGVSAVVATGAAGAARSHTLISVRAGRTHVGASRSTNWSGYDVGILDRGTPFTSVGGRWTVPTATAHTVGQTEASATWVGIGGGCLDSSCTATDSTLIQAGTEQDVAANGTATYSAWWESVPAPAVTASIAVHPGDVVQCTIAVTLPGIWTISLTDVTDGQGFTRTVPYPSTEGSAEWIEETPVVIGTSGAGIAALPNLSMVSFSDATVNGTNAALVPDEAVQLVGSNGAPVATPSAPGSAADDFAVCSYSSSCPAPA